MEFNKPVSNPMMVGSITVPDAVHRGRSEVLHGVH